MTETPARSASMCRLDHLKNSTRMTSPDVDASPNFIITPAICWSVTASMPHRRYAVSYALYTGFSAKISHADGMVGMIDWRNR